MTEDDDGCRDVALWLSWLSHGFTFRDLCILVVSWFGLYWNMDLLCVRMLALFFLLLRCFLSEKLWRSSTWYSNILPFVCAFVLLCSLVDAGKHVSVSTCLLTSSLFLSLPLPSLTVMPATCEPPGQGTSKRFSTTSNLGLRSTSVIRYVFWDVFFPCICPQVKVKYQVVFFWFCTHKHA